MVGLLPSALMALDAGTAWSTTSTRYAVTRDLARAVELRIILAHKYCRAGQAIVFSCVVGV
jgi:hypothetical protein